MSKENMTRQLKENEIGYIKKMLDAYTQEELTAGIGISRKTLNNALNGKPLSKRTITLINDFCNKAKRKPDTSDQLPTDEEYTSSQELTPYEKALFGRSDASREWVKKILDDSFLDLFWPTDDEMQFFACEDLIGRENAFLNTFQGKTWIEKSYFSELLRLKKEALNNRNLYILLQRWAYLYNRRGKSFPYIDDSSDVVFFFLISHCLNEHYCSNIARFLIRLTAHMLKHSSFGTVHFHNGMIETNEGTFVSENDYYLSFIKPLEPFRPKTEDEEDEQLTDDTADYSFKNFPLRAAYPIDDPSGFLPDMLFNCSWIKNPGCDNEEKIKGKDTYYYDVATSDKQNDYLLTFSLTELGREIGEWYNKAFKQNS